MYLQHANTLHTIATGLNPFTRLPMEDGENLFNNPDVIKALLSASEALIKLNEPAPVIAVPQKTLTPVEKKAKVAKTKPKSELYSIKIEQKRQKNIDNNMPSRRGFPWTPKEVSMLTESFGCKVPVADIAAAHYRTEVSIIVKLIDLKLIKPLEDATTYHLR